MATLVEGGPATHVQLLLAVAGPTDPRPLTVCRWKPHHWSSSLRIAPVRTIQVSVPRLSQSPLSPCKHVLLTIDVASVFSSFPLSMVSCIP